MGDEVTDQPKLSAEQREEIYEICQAYRHSSVTDPSGTAARYEELLVHIESLLAQGDAEWEKRLAEKVAAGEEAARVECANACNGWALTASTDDRADSLVKMGEFLRSCKTTGALARHTAEAVEKATKELREVLQAALDWDAEYRAINKLGSKGPHWVSRAEESLSMVAHYEAKRLLGEKE